MAAPRSLSCSLSLLALVAWSSHALAQEPTITAERLRAAEEEHDAGRRAFLANQFEEAAVHFENAFRDAPRAQALRNAIRARQLAKQGARAATLADLARRRYPADPQTVQLADAVLAELAPTLLDVKIRCTPDCGVAADGRIVSFSEAPALVVYLEPGRHEVVASWSGGRAESRRIEGAARAHLDLVLIAPPLAAVKPEVAPPVGPSPRLKVLQPAQESSGLSPAFFFVGLGLTVAAGVATTISGISTLNSPGKEAVRTGCVGQGTSCPLYQSGLDGETRTNIGIGATLGLAAATAIVGVFFTGWSGKKTPPPIAVGLGTVGLSGRF